MAFQSEIELRVKVLDKELDDLEKRIKRVANPFSASGAAKNKGVQAAKTELQVERNRLKLAQDLNVERVKTLNLNSSWVKALRQMKEIQEDIVTSVEKENRVRAKTQQQNRNRRTRGLLEGVGFPLLFGAGPGAIAGGGLGGVFGAAGGFGFGAQAIGTALGAAIDNYIQGLSKLADSLESTKGVISGLEEAGYKVSEGVKSQIAVYQQAGQESKAYAAAVEEINRILGPDGASKVSDYRVESEKLQQEFSNAKAALDAELLPAMTGFIRLVLELKSAFDQIADSRLGKILGRAFRETITDNVPGLQEGIRAFQGLQQLGTPSGDVQIPFEQTEAALASATKLAEQTEKQQRAEWEKADALRHQNEILALQIEAAQAGTDLADEAVYLARKRIIERETLNGLIENALNPLKREQIILEGTLKLLNLSNQRKAALDRPKRKGPKAPESRALQLQAQLIEGEKTRFDLAVQRARIVEGERAALQLQTAGLQARLEQEIDIINLREEQALKNNKVKADEELIRAVFAQQRDLAQDKLDLARLQNLEREKALKLARDLAEIEGRQAVDRLRTDLERQIDDTNFQTANPFGGPEAERLQLAAEQLYRYEDAMKNLADQEEKLKRQLEDDPRNEVLAKNIQNVRDLRAVYEELLPALDAAEQRQLKLNQTLEMLQPITDALAAGIADIFTSLIDGSKSAEEAFADMLQSMGQQLIQTATQALMNQAVQMLLKFFSTASTGAPAWPAPPPLPGLAGGGTAMADRPYLVGETGPEVFVPQTNGRVVNNTDSQMALDRYTRQDNTPTRPDQPIKIEYTSTTIAGEDYVTVGQFQQGMAAAAKQGAKSGETRVMSSLRNSRSRRKQLGL